MTDINKDFIYRNPVFEK